MRGDWTQPNKEISDFLHRSNRYGIPFNAIYGPNYPNGILFSEILNLKEIKNNFSNIKN